MAKQGSLRKCDNFESLLQEIGLIKYFPKKLGVCDAIQFRDIIEDAPQNSELYPFLILQKIMAFDSQCRIPFKISNETQESNDSHDTMQSSKESHGVKSDSHGAKSSKESNDAKLDESSDSESDESDNGDSIHPMDGLLALIYCCDDFLRQDIFNRMATCQIALPLLLPDPYTGELTMLLWAMRTIVKEFALPDDKTCNNRIVKIPMPLVSFLRVGSHDISKSEIMNETMCNKGSDNRNQPFFDYNSPGGTNKKFLVKGLVEISWYLPGIQTKLFPNPVAFVNLRGDASDPQLEKQVHFLCDISAVNVLLLSSDIFKEDATREGAINLLKKLSRAPGKSIVIKTKKDKKLEKVISEAVGESLYQSKFEVLKHERSKTLLFDKLKVMLTSMIISDTCKAVSLSSIAYDSEFALDEHDCKCATGQEIMKKIYSVVESCNVCISKPEGSVKGLLPHKSRKDLLPLQSPDLWHKWASLDKEQYRQKRKPKTGIIMAHHGEQKSIQAKEYSEQLQIQMESLQRQQYDKVKRQENDGNAIPQLLPLFIDALRTADKMVLCYFMRWLKINLDDLSRELLTPLYAKLFELRSRLCEAQDEGNENKERTCIQKLQEINSKMISASFGVEHLMREVGQMYETVAEYEDVTQPECSVRDLPQIAAQLMLYDGFALELLDGEASNMPKNWISAVFTSLAKLLKGESDSDPEVFVLSVLGIQSSGKSTLLNTVFGVQFAVSAGRCTRGAFMQLIPVHSSLHEKTKVQYLLLIDTEGLRAPELDRQEALEHDNELATFVIGIANQTLINIRGEVAGEIEDVLNAAVIAFMRMSEVSLKPSCHIIHQNVPAVGAEEKLMQGRLKTKEKLDKMTKAAAKEMDLESKYKLFNDAIRFHHRKDVSEFVGLWNGELPMAHICSGYSKRAQQLKVNIIEIIKQFRSRNTLPLLRSHLEKLWNAILQEDFVFTFQNIYEIVAYKAVEVKYSDCACKFMTEMNVQQQAAEYELYGCTPTDLDTTLEKHTRLFEISALKSFKKYEQEMNDFFKEDDLMLKWKQETEMRLKNLHKELERNAKETAMQLYQARIDLNEAERERESISMKIKEEVSKLTEIIGHKKCSEEELTALFDDKVNNLIVNMKLSPFIMPDIPRVVEECIIKFFPVQLSNIRAKVCENEGTRKFEIEEKHIMIKKTSMLQKTISLLWKSPLKHGFIQKANSYTCQTFDEIENFLKLMKKMEKNFSSQLVTDILKLVQKRSKMQIKEFEFTDIYEVEVAVAACRIALPVFEEFAHNFKRRYDPHVFVVEEMKPNFRRLFLDTVNKVNFEKTAAERLCSQMKRPMEKYIFQSLPTLIFKEVTSSFVWTKHKQTFIGKILLEMGKELDEKSGFFLCIDFLTNPRYSFEYWAKLFIENYCHSGTPSHLSVMAKNELNKTIDFLIKKAESTSQTLSQLEKVYIHMWIKHFHTEISSTIKIPLSDLNMYVQDQELTHLEFFTDHVKKELENFRSVLCQNVTYSQTQERESVHEMVVKKVAGCIEQCPFCGAQCEHTNSDHLSGKYNIPHKTQHRINAFGYCEWAKNQTAVLEVCTKLVTTDHMFSSVATKGKNHPVSIYHELYPDWVIPQNKSGEASLYWKWFIGKYSDSFEAYFNFAKTDIPKQWKKIEWNKVKRWLVTEYDITC